ncbi:DUF4270 family protein [Sphingobacterium kitahiroshimense]|uniref:DUF4270 family protein n=1 Tax=Sphingobacterium kitahiroshimense TaxID=470446 RepID=A0ABV0BW08_9SPHI
MSCKDEDGLTINMDEDKLKVNAADTLTIIASTFLLDPLPTAEKDVMTVGNIQDPQFGKMALSSYFRLSTAELSLNNLPEDITYDSLSIEFYYNQYSYGDTSKALQFEVYRVLQDIEPKKLPIAIEDDEYPVFVSEATLYANQTFDHDPIALGRTTVYPRPKTDTLKFRMDDNLGRTLFNMAINKDSKLMNNDEFTDYFKGLVLRSDGNGHAVVGLQDSVKVRIHYSYYSETDGKKNSDALVLGMGPRNYQYNHIVADRSGTALTNLTEENQEVATSITDYRTFIQGGTGIVTRLKFPTLRSFLTNDHKALSKATLIVETEQSLIGNQPPPSSLLLLEANKYGTPTAIVKTFTGEAVANYQALSPTGAGSKGKYEFDVTSYVSKYGVTSGFDESQSLMLSLPIKDLLSSVQQLSITKNETKPAIKLHLLYVNY